MEPDEDTERSSESSGGQKGDQPRLRVLYPLFDTYNKHSFEFALDIAVGADAKLLVLDLVADRDSLVDESRTVGSELLRIHLEKEHHVETELILKENKNPVKTVAKVARRRSVHLLVVDEQTPATLTGIVRRDVPNRISNRAACDAVTVTRACNAKRIRSILVPIAGGKHSKLAVVIAGAIAMSVNAVVDLFHVSSSKDTIEKQRVEDLFSTAKEQLPDQVAVDTWHIEQSRIATAIVEQSRHYDVTVIGKPRTHRLLRFITGSITDEVTDQSLNTVLTTHRDHEPGFQL